MMSPTKKESGPRGSINHTCTSLILACSLATGCESTMAKASNPSGDSQVLPPADTNGGIGLHKALFLRRSIRQFKSRDLSVEEMGQLLWAGQGISSPRGYRTAPSAGALYPIEIHLVTSKGVFKYNPMEHRLSLLSKDDKRRDLSTAALHQEFVAQAPVTFVVAGIPSRTSAKYGDRAERYVVFEAGAVAQNILLEAVNLQLGAVVVGAFRDSDIRRVASLPKNSIPVVIVSVGEPQ
jgi:SagB-type dehydrogenase family enzyme